MTSNTPRIPPDLFPLPLAAFEEYMLRDDRPAFPMTFFIELTLSGNLDRTAFAAALEHAVARHPLLGCVAVRNGGRWNWVPNQRPPAVIWAEGEPPLPARAVHRLDLSGQPGLRVWVGWRFDGSRVAVQFHHAATDGLGAMRFLGDLLALYGRQTASREQELPDLPPLDAAVLHRRAELWSRGTRPADLWSRSRRHFVQLVSRRATDLAPPLREPLSRPSPSGLPYVTRLLDRKTGNALRTGSLARGVTLNETYLLALFRTLRLWNASGGRDARREYFQIVIPATFRTPIHDACPAANLLSYVYLNRRGDEVDSLDALAGIHAESQQLLRSADARLFAWFVEQLQRCPGALRLATRLPVRFCTAVLSNVGDLRRQFGVRFPLEDGRCIAGNVRLEQLTGVPPIRPRTSVAVAVASYAGTHLVNVNCDPGSLPGACADEFADLYMSRLLDLEREFGRHAQTGVAAA